MDIAPKPMRGALQSGLLALQLDLNVEQLDQLLAYQSMITKWNRTYNLTAVRDSAEMLTHHLLDSLAIVPALTRHLLAAGMSQSSRLLDVGSGAGLPGVVIAICCPTISVTCVDTVAKKTAFIKQVALVLKLPNLIALHTRVEEVKQPFDVVCARAFASLADFTRLSIGALAPHGVWLAMKARQPASEVAELSAAIEMFHVEQLTVPGLEAERRIVWLRPASGR